jgi:mucin-19
MATYNPLQSIALTASAANVTFSNIDQGYTDLVLVFSGQVTSAVSLALQLNGDTASNYSVIELSGDGSTATSSRSANAASMTISSVGAQIGTGTPWVSTLHFQSYSNTTTNKPVLMKTSAPGTITTLNTGLYRSTAAITSIRIMGFANASGFTAGSTFDLYGIKSGAPQALGGDTVTTDGNYWYHTFRSTAAFIPQKTLSVEYLVVGAGGAGAPGGSSSSGAGAGGGGSSSSTFTSTSNASYTVTVGGGGTGPGIAGSSSTISGSNISTITAGGGNPERDNRVGGLGGTGTSGTGGTGGNGVIGTSVGNGTNGAAGNAFSISGTSTTYGGGGGGAGRGGGTHGTGGAGGGGNAGSTGSAGTANTGGGGGGTSTDNTNGGNGGSGIVIVRYPV